MKKIIRLTENDLFKIVKRVLNEQENETNKLEEFVIRPIVKGTPGSGVLRIKADLVNKKIYTMSGVEIGFSSPEEFKKNINSEIYDNGKDFLDEYLERSGIGLSSFFQMRLDCNYYGFVFDTPYGSEAIPTLMGFKKDGQGECKGSSATKVPSFIEPSTETTTLPPTPDPRTLKLDLTNVFLYDCPGMIGCQSPNQPFVDPTTELKIIQFGKTLGRLVIQDPTNTIKNTQFYILGFASSENPNRPDFLSHNGRLSQLRAEYTVNLINQGLKQVNSPKLKITPVGMGPTTLFGNNWTDNRRLMLTTTTRGTNPVLIKVDYDNRGNITNVKIN